MQNCKSTIFQYLKKEMQRRSSIKRTLKDIIVCFLSREKKKKKKKPYRREIQHSVPRQQCEFSSTLFGLAALRKKEFMINSAWKSCRRLT